MHTLENIINSLEKVNLNQNYQQHLKQATATWNQQIQDLTHYWQNIFKDKS